jgi:uncharacterized protein YjaZ
MTKGLVVSAYALFLGCAQHELTVDFFRSETYTFSWSEQRAIEFVARSTLKEVRPLLPALPANIQLTVRPGRDVIEETGETASAMAPDAILWTVNPHREGGVAAITHQWLRASLFHEFHHLVRWSAAEPHSIIDHALFEGMATAFERDFAGVKTPWADYPPNVREWAAEIRKLPEDASSRDWLYSHPDGRRWIGMKVGTYWIDQAIAKSGRSSANLSTASTRDLLALIDQ